MILKILNLGQECKITMMMMMILTIYQHHHLNKKTSSLWEYTFSNQKVTLFVTLGHKQKY